MKLGNLATCLTGLITAFTLLTSACKEQKQSTAEPAEEWSSLLDKNLSQWEMYLSYRHLPTYNGDMPLDENGDPIPPIGYNKNEGNVFAMMEENGKPVLRISGEIYGCVFTKQEYENYHLK